MKSKPGYVALLRGINVGGHHKVPMQDLRRELGKINLNNTVTLLNSGNVLFDSDEDDLENKISTHLEEAFGFQIPTLVWESEMIRALLEDNPFTDIKVTKDIRLYVSFLKEEVDTGLTLPWKSPDASHQIIGKRGKTVFSVVDVSLALTPKAMNTLEKFYGKDITTRNWNTIERIGKVFSA